MSVAVGTKYPVKVTSGIDVADPEGDHTEYAEKRAGSQATEDADGQENGQAAEDADGQPKIQAGTQDEKSDVKTGKKNKK